MKGVGWGGLGWMRLNDKDYYKIKKEKFNYKYYLMIIYFDLKNNIF